MGLEIVPVTQLGDRHVAFSYHHFHSFRRRLAEAVGIDLETMEGFGGETEWPSPMDEPLVALLNHSDSHGELFLPECEMLAPRLRQLVKQSFPETADSDAIAREENEYIRTKGLELADACDAVADGTYAWLEFL